MSTPKNLPRAKGSAFTLDTATVTSGAAAARASDRQRIMMQLHRSDTEGVQRLLNFMQPGSYAQPHCHPAPENCEVVVALQGVVGFLVFDEAGAIRAVHRLVPGVAGSCLVDIEPGVWHTVIPLAPDTLVLEIKRGPYNAATDKTFAAWAPREGSADGAGYLRQLESAFAS